MHQMGSWTIHCSRKSMDESLRLSKQWWMSSFKKMTETMTCKRVRGWIFSYLHDNFSEWTHPQNTNTKRIQIQAARKSSSERTRPLGLANAPGPCFFSRITSINLSCTVVPAPTCPDENSTKKNGLCPQLLRWKFHTKKIGQGPHLLRWKFQFLFFWSDEE